MRWVIAVLVGLGVGAGALFVVQNLSREVTLSYDLYFAAWQLSEPVSVPLLMAICFAAGALTGLLAVGGRLWSSGRRVKELERQVAMHGVQGGSDDGWR